MDSSQPVTATVGQTGAGQTGVGQTRPGQTTTGQTRPGQTATGQAHTRQTRESGPPHVAVIGAGAVGTATALSLLREGLRVTLVDRAPPAEGGASFGNASIIGDEPVAPIAMPGILWRVPGMLTDPMSPLALRWRYLPQLTPWLLRFVLASRPAEVERISIALKALLGDCIESFEPLLGPEGMTRFLRRTGWLCLYESERGWRDHAGVRDIQARRGVAFSRIPAAELRQFEPNLAPAETFHSGVLYENVAHTVDNLGLVKALAETFRREGGHYLQAEAREFLMGPEGPRGLATSAGEVTFDRLVIAAGAWSGELAKRLGSRVPLDTERGYHLQLADYGPVNRMPVFSPERGFAATPLAAGLRLAGTVEMGGLASPPDWRRAEALLAHARRWFPNMEEGGQSRWMGFRPSMPDSLPVISRSPRHANTVFAFGHGHCGLMLSAKTGRLVADLLLDRPSGIDMTPYRVDRF